MDHASLEQQQIMVQQGGYTLVSAYILSYSNLAMMRLWHGASEDWRSFSSQASKQWKLLLPSVHMKFASTNPFAHCSQTPAKEMKTYKDPQVTKGTQIPMLCLPSSGVTKVLCAVSL